MRIAITGATGRLGKYLVDYGLKNKHTVIPWTRKELNLENPSAISNLLTNDIPDIVIHAAALTDVEYCALNPMKATLINAASTKEIAAACAKADVHFIYISTNEVFDGTSDEPYEISDKVNPINNYGFSKLLGELASFHGYENSSKNLAVIRTSWLFGSGIDFVSKVINKANEQISKREFLTLVNDEFGSPTSADDMAKTIIENIEALNGVYHIVNDGVTSRAGFAREILALVQKDVLIEEVPSSRFKRESTPPLKAILAPSFSLRSWQAALAANMRDRGLL